MYLARYGNKVLIKARSILNGMSSGHLFIVKFKKSISASLYGFEDVKKSFEFYLVGSVILTGVLKIVLGSPFSYASFN